MATHFVCQSTEPLPHLYPTGLAKKAHGAVSQYEVYNAGTKAHTQFPPPGWDFSQTSEEDSLPLMQPAPQPEWRNTSLHPDPDLCITPQKPQVPGKTAVMKHGMTVYEKNRFDPDPQLTLTPEKSFNDSARIYDKNNYVTDKSKKVRFELENSDDKPLNVNDEPSFIVKEKLLSENIDSKSTKTLPSNKQYIPGNYGEEKKDQPHNLRDMSGKSETSSGKSRTVKYTVSKAGDQLVYLPMTEDKDTCEPSSSKVMSDRPTDKSKLTQGASVKKDGQSTSVKVVREKSNSKSVSDPIAACRVPEEPGTKRKVKVFRENQYAPKETDYTFPFGQNALDFAGGEEHMFTRPEYNSTLKMKVEAERLKQSEIDIEHALKKKLHMSERTKTDINEKAASHVNKQGSTFAGLVSLDLPAEQICQQAAELKTARAKVTTAAKTKHKDHKEPDLLEFFTADRQKESVTYSLPGISAPTEHLTTAPHWRAFDLYKHNRVWEGRGNKK